MEKNSTEEAVLHNDSGSENTTPDETIKDAEVPESLRNRIYDRIEVSVKTMDLIIGGLVILLIALLIWGILT